MSAPEGPLGELVRAVAAHWTALLDALDPPARQELTALMRTVGDRDPAGVLVELEDLIMDSALPAGHPLMDVIRRAGGRPRGVQGVDLDVEGALAWLASQLPPEFVAAVSEPGGPVAAGSGPAGPVTRETVLHRLAAVPSYAVEEVDEVPPELIRLRGRLPRFQFDAQRRPHAVVLEVNRLLDAAHDPWGVASWWLDRHSWLGAAPADLLDRSAADRRRLAVAAAAAVAD